MKPETEETTQQAQPPVEAPARPEAFLQALLDWKGAPDRFWGFLLEAQCRLSGAPAAAVFRAGAEGIGVLAVYPGQDAQAEARDWNRFAPAAAEALEGGRPAVKALSGRDDLYGQAPRRLLAILPLPSPDPAVKLAGAYLLGADQPAAVELAVERLEWTAGLLRVAGVGSELARRQTALRRLTSAMETLSAVNEHDRFAAAAMCLCNELASRWTCDRVGLGILRGRYVRLRALSHTEKFSRKMELVQEIETVMEECLDQDVEILVPAGAEATYGFREASKFASRHGPLALLAVPLRGEGKVQGVLTLERPADKPLTPDEIETLRLACDLCTPRVLGLEKQDRWVGAKLVSGLRSAAAFAVGSAHTGIKLIVLAVLAFILFAVFVKGDYQAEASFFLEPDERRVICAPYDGVILEANAMPGDVVRGGDGNTPLAILRTTDLRKELVEANAAWSAYSRQASSYLAAGRMAESQIAQFQAEGAQAQVSLIESRIQQARLISPIDGVVIFGDLRRRINDPVRTGEALFEVAPVQPMHAELLVPEDQVADVEANQMGTLATASKPDEKARFIVERIDPVAEVVGQKNVFRVRARLLDTYPWMRLGLEGVAKVRIDRRSYAWIWSRPVVNWVRMKLWI